MLANMIQRRFPFAVRHVDPAWIDIKYVLRCTPISCHGAVVKRLSLLLIRGSYEVGMVIFKELEDVSSILLLDLTEMLGVADCSVHYAKASFVDCVNVGI